MTREALAADEEELDVARSTIEAGQYAEAAARLERMLDSTVAACPDTPELTAGGCRVTDATVILRTRGYYAIALVALERDIEATRQLEEILRVSPTFSPSPAIFPRRVIELFLEVRRGLESDLTAQARDEQRRRAEREQRARQDEAWIQRVAKLAQEETVVNERSRWIAAIPFGVGQFQNEDTTLGIVLLTAESLLVGATVVTGVIHDDLATRALDASQDFDRAELNNQLDTLRVGNWVSAAVLGALVLGGIADAQLRFVESTTTTVPRAVPPRPTPPTVSLTGVPSAPDALGFGVMARF